MSVQRLSYGVFEEGLSLSQNTYIHTYAYVLAHLPRGVQSPEPLILGLKRPVKTIDRFMYTSPYGYLLNNLYLMQKVSPTLCKRCCETGRTVYRPSRSPRGLGRLKVNSSPYSTVPAPIVYEPHMMECGSM